jgi:hypothetical protein
MGSEIRKCFKNFKESPKEDSQEMRFVDYNNRITMGELNEMASAMFGDLVKGVIDLRRESMVLDAELHSDEEAALINSGSDQYDLWGINLHPEIEGEEFVEFDSMINIRPSHANRSRNVEDPAIRKRILEIVNRLVVA